MLASQGMTRTVFSSQSCLWISTATIMCSTIVFLRDLDDQPLTEFHKHHIKSVVLSNTYLLSLVYLIEHTVQIMELICGKYSSILKLSETRPLSNFLHCYPKCVVYIFMSKFIAGASHIHISSGKNRKGYQRHNHSYLKRCFRNKTFDLLTLHQPKLSYLDARSLGNAGFYLGLNVPSERQ